MSHETNVVFPDKMWGKLQKATEETSLTQSELIRISLVDYLKNNQLWGKEEVQ